MDAGVLIDLVFIHFDSHDDHIFSYSKRRGFARSRVLVSTTD